MNWIKASDCEGAACVQVALEPGEVLVRNSTIPGEVVWFVPDEWRLFIEGVKRGEFDL